MLRADGNQTILRFARETRILPSAVKEVGMRQVRFRMLVIVLTLASGGGYVWLEAQGTDTTRQAEAALQAAITKETLEGNPTSSLAEYAEIVNRYPTVKTVAANALLRQAGLYRKLGRTAEERAAYERLASQYGDQAAAATARTQLGTSATARTKAVRPVWTVQSAAGAGTVSGDGRFLSFVDWETSNLGVRDLVAGTDVQLTSIVRGSGDSVDDSAISRDGTKIAYSWWIQGRTNELRIVNRVSSGVPTPRTLLAKADASYFDPLDWFPDGESIAVTVKRPDGTAQIGLVTAADGRLTTLKSIDWRGVGRLSISPDGGYLAYDVPVGDSGNEREILILSRNGAQESRVSARPGYHLVVGWTPDGKSLLFATERSGTMGLWAVPVAAGKPQASPQIVDPDLGTFFGSLGVTSTGRLLFTKKLGGINVYTAAVDFTTGKLPAPPEPVTESLVANHPGAMWSPDGQSLAYPSIGRGTTTMVIRALGTGATRVLTPRVARMQFPRWTAHDFITFQGSDLKGRQGIFALNVQSGETTMLAGGDQTGYRSWADATPDGRFVVYTLAKNNPAGFGMIVRDLRSGEERELAPRGTVKAVSPDGQSVANIQSDATSSWISLYPLSGGTPREIARTTRPETLGNVLAWLPDGRHVVAGRWSQGKWDGLVVMPVGGGPHVRVPLETAGPFFSVHPDGRRIAFSAGDPTFEVWSLENFLPATTTAAKR